MGKFKWGLIGPGRIAQRFAESFAALESAELHAVASSNLKRGKAFAAKHGCRKAYDSYEELIKDPEVDAVYIANPHRFHFASAEACIEAGKPVLLEKPLTVNANEASFLIELANDKGVFLMEALWSRFLPVWLKVKSWVYSGIIGDIVLLDSRFGFPIPRDETDRLLNPVLAGGVLLDMGVYNVSMSQYVMDSDPEHIVCDGLVGSTGVDERVSAILNYGDAVSQFTCNFQAFTKNNFVIYGKLGHIEVEPYFWDTTKAKLVTNTGYQEDFEEPFLANGFEYQIMHAMQRILAGKLESDVITWNDTMGTQKVMDEILQTLGIRFQFDTLHTSVA